MVPAVIWGLSSWFIVGTFLLCPHMVEGARNLSGASFYKALISFMRAPPSCLSTSQRPHLLNHHPLAVRISTYEFGGGQIQTIAEAEGSTSKVVHLTQLASWCWLLAGRLSFSPCESFYRAAWVASRHSTPSFTGACHHLSTSHWSLQSALFQCGHSRKLMFYWRLKTWGWAGNGVGKGK